ncbi:Fc.00g073480.m01.CDS01 [Cosmosporella sp. VM-42]
MNVPLKIVRLVAEAYTSYADIYFVEGGAACWDCAKNGYTCRPVPVEAHAAVRAFWTFNRLRGADNIPDEAWRAAAQWAAQKLRACGSGEVAPATPRPAPDLASFSEVAERSLEERKVIALETIAGVVQLWFQLDQPDEEEEGEEKENGDN